jgi:hypothetical protein
MWPRWSRFAAKTLLVAAGAVALQVPLAQPASAGWTVVNGTSCTPFLSNTMPPAATTPIHFPYGNRLQVYRNGADWNFLINCPLPAINGGGIASGGVTLAVVDGRSLGNVRLCYGSYYSDAMSCGAASTYTGPAYFVYPPASIPSGATAPFLLISATVTAANSPVVVRGVTAWWSDP